MNFSYSAHYGYMYKALKNIFNYVQQENITFTYVT